MNLWKTLIFLLILCGIGVAAVSVYDASLTGVMKKMGLVSGDYSNAYDQGLLAEINDENLQNQKCDFVSAIAHLPEYMMGIGGVKMKLAYDLGNQRILCGYKQLLNKDIERGTYTLLKGMRYIQTGYEIVEGQNNLCGRENGLFISEPYLVIAIEAASGNARDNLVGASEELSRVMQSVREGCRLY